MRTNARLDAGQWDAIAACQQHYGVPDRLIALVAGCGVSTVAGRRKHSGWAMRALPDGFIQQAECVIGADGRVGSGEADEPLPGVMPGEADMQAALARLMTMMVQATLHAAAEGADGLDLKRIDILAGAIKAHEKLIGMRLKMAPADAAPTPLEETQAVLAEMDRRVDELADRRARYFIGQWCQGRGCLERAGRAGATPATAD